MPQNFSHNLERPIPVSQHTDTHTITMSMLHNETLFVRRASWKPGGEDGLGLPRLNGANSSKGHHSQDGDASYPKLDPLSSRDLEWMLIEPIPVKALSTSLTPSPVEVARELTHQLAGSDLSQTTSSAEPQLKCDSPSPLPSNVINYTDNMIKLPSIHTNFAACEHQRSRPVTRI